MNKSMDLRRIYVASSWRNQDHSEVVHALRLLGHRVYDFKHPQNEEKGFSWKDAGYEPNPQKPSIAAYLTALASKEAHAGFHVDMTAMYWADTFVLLLPCGRSAHIEAGWALGRDKEVFIVLSEEKFEPELMYLMAGFTHILQNKDALLHEMSK